MRKNPMRSVSLQLAMTAACAGLVAAAGCDSGGSASADPKCMANAEVICQKACECNQSSECSQEYPSGSSQTFNSESQCLNAWRSYCADVTEGLLDYGACTADLQNAPCIPSGDHEAVDIPHTCYRYLSTPECMEYGEQICDRACACDGAGACPVKLTSSFSIVFGSWGECNSNMTGSCDQDLTGITDYPTCVDDLTLAACVDTGDNTGIELPSTCWNG